MKPYKKDFSYSYTIGVYPTIELLTHKPEQILNIYLSSKGKGNKGVEKITELAHKLRIKTAIEDGLINKLSASENNYAIGVFKKYTDQLKPEAHHILLVNPSDMGNIGTIIRTMAGFIFRNLAIIKPAADIFNPKVIRASMGEIFQTNIQYFATLDDYRKQFKHTLYFITGNGQKSIDTIKLLEPYTLVFGNEGAGLPAAILKTGTTVHIPQSPTIDSLNLSIAAGITLYEAYKKTQNENLKTQS